MFVDLHCHILPGIDDGAAAIEESVEMARELASQGFRVVFATPHHIPGVYEPSGAVVVSGVAELQSALDLAGIPLMILPGHEVALDGDVVGRLKSGELLTLGDRGRHLLVELPMHEVPRWAGDVLFELVMAGVIPILAHPERNSVLAEKPERAYDLIRSGVLMQLTIGSFAGYFGRTAQRAADYFVRQGWVQFLGTDAHHPGERAVLSERALGQLTDEQVKTFLGDNPERVIRGEEFSAVPEPPATTGRGTGLRNLFGIRGRL